MMKKVMKAEKIGNKEEVDLASSLIRTWDICWVISDKKLKDSGLKKGDTVLVSGTKVVPATKKDPYLQRVLCFVVKIVNDKVQIPTEKNDYMAYLVDPRNLEKVDEKTLKWAHQLLEDQYGSTS